MLSLLVLAPAGVAIWWLFFRGDLFPTGIEGVFLVCVTAVVGVGVATALFGITTALLPQVFGTELRPRSMADGSAQFSFPSPDYAASFRTLNEQHLRA